MDIQEYHRMYDLEDRHWWFQGRLFMIEGWLERFVWSAYRSRPEPPRLLDVGCGTGLFLDRRTRDCRAYGVDRSLQALTYCRSRGLARIALCDGVRLPFPDESFDIVTAFDLIEHVADDQGLVNEFRRVLRRGGYLIATVPAHPFLWTGHDLRQHHKRRYRRSEFERLFAAGGWRTVRMSAGFTVMFIPAAVIRLTRRLSGRMTPQSDLRMPAPWFNRLLVAVHRAEAAWLRRFDLPIGISLLTIRQKG